MAAPIPMTSGDERPGRAPLRVLPGGEVALDDEALARAFRDGDEGAFAELFRRHAPLVHALVRRYAPAPEEQRDLVQRTFLRALESSRGRRTEVAFRPWLARIAVNLSKNHLRDARRRRSAPLEAAPEPAGAPEAEEAMARGERERLVREAVLRLPPRQREVLTLRVDGELPFAEIARALGISENAAKVSFHHAARRLRLLLAGTEGEP